MKNGLIRMGQVILAGLVVGCAGQKTALQQPVCIDTIAKEKIMQATEKTLVAMQFAIAKYDLENGIIRTHPLRGGQFFELWRSDNASGYNAAESNLQSVQRTVEITFNSEATRQCIHCTATAQRLSLPEEPIEGYLSAPAIHTESDRGKQQLNVDSERMDKVQWIDLGRDQALESKILNKIQKTIAKGLK
jgi:hypothetical protein